MNLTTTCPQSEKPGSVLSSEGSLGEQLALPRRPFYWMNHLLGSFLKNQDSWNLLLNMTFWAQEPVLKTLAFDDSLNLP